MSVYLGPLVSWSLGFSVPWSLGLLVLWCLGLWSCWPLNLSVPVSLVSWSLGLLVSWSLVSLSFSPSLVSLSLSLPHSCYVRSEGEKRLSGQIDFSKGVYIHLLANTVLDILGAGVPNMGRGGGLRIASHKARFPKWKVGGRNFSH